MSQRGKSESYFRLSNVKNAEYKDPTFRALIIIYKSLKFPPSISKSSYSCSFPNLLPQVTT